MKKEEYVEVKHHPVMLWVVVVLLGAVLMTVPNLGVGITEFLFWNDDGHMAISGHIAIALGLLLVAVAAMRLTYYAKEH